MTIHMVMAQVASAAWCYVFSNFQIEYWGSQYCKHPFDCSKNRLYGVYLNFSWIKVNGNKKV